MSEGGGRTGPIATIPVLTSAVRRRWTSSVFGIVATGAVRRRPSDIARIVLALVVIAATAAGADDVSALEESVFRVIAELPGGLTGVFEVIYWAGVVVAGVLVVSALWARRLRLLFTLVVAGGVSWAAASALSAAVDVPHALVQAGADLHGHSPDYPVVRLVTAGAVMLAARPYLTRPARRLLEVAFWLSALSAAYLAEGLPGAVIGSLIMAWGVAALAHFVFGSPGGTPSLRQVTSSLADMGVDVEDLELVPDRAWGHTTFRSPADPTLHVEVVGRDSTDARLFAKAWRFLWYKDSGPTLTLSRAQQVEHQAFLLMLGARTGARLPDLVAVGLAGARDDALLVVRNPPGVRLADLDPDRVDDAVLDDAWRNLARLHDASIAHGNAGTTHVVVDDEGVTGVTGFDNAQPSAPPERVLLDGVQLLVTTGALVGAERALAAAERALGTEGIEAVLPLLEPAALTPSSRDAVDDLKSLLVELREQGAELSDTEAPKPAALRRFSVGSVVLAGAFALGVYLLVGQLAGVAAMGDIFQGAEIPWVIATFILAQGPQFSQAVAMLGAVSSPLPLGPVTGVQFANAFTGLVGGTAGNATLVIRFFQKQGLPPAVAVSSGVLNSLAGFIVQAVLVIVGLLITGSSFDLNRGGDSVPGWVLALLAAVGVALIVLLLVPRVRARIRNVVESQLKAAFANLRGVLSTPRKAVELFGGNLVSQVLFAMVLGAALHAYGESLPLLQLIVINSFASFVGGAAPVPGGMGVVEAGLIGGFTAAGISQTDAVAATFTARMFTSYLPPIWGWFSLSWLREHDYV